MGGQSLEFTVLSQGNQPPGNFCKQSVRGRKRALVMSSPAGFPPDPLSSISHSRGKTQEAHVPARVGGGTACPTFPILRVAH